MIKQNIIKISLIALVLASLTSCVSDVDFNQAEVIMPSPTLESNLIYSTLIAPNFIDQQTQLEAVMVSDTTRLEVLSSDFFVDQLAKANLSFKFTNSIQRDFLVDFEFLNDTNELRYHVQVLVHSGVVTNPILSETTVLIDEPEITTFKEATKLVYKISLPPSTSPIGPNSQGQLDLQSKATLYFEL